MSRFRSLLRQYPVLRFVTPRVYCIDIGSSTTRIAVDGKVVYQQPSCLVLHTSSGTVLEIGKKAAQVVGKTPAHVTVVFPLKRGCIKDQRVFEWYVQALLQKITPPTWGNLLWPSKVYIGLPGSTSEVEKELWTKIWQQAGLGKVVIVEKPSPLVQSIYTAKDPEQNQVKILVDSGGGTTEIVACSGKTILAAETLPIGGKDISEVIIKTVLKEYACEIGYATAEKIKMNIKSQDSVKTTVRGKNVLSGLPTTSVIDNQVVVEAAMKVLKPIGQSLKTMIAALPAEVMSHTAQIEVVLMGGTGQFWGYDLYLQSLLKANVVGSRQPSEEVLRGLIALSQKAYGE